MVKQKKQGCEQNDTFIDQWKNNHYLKTYFIGLNGILNFYGTLQKY